MKEKILPFIIGVLVGAIIATGGFYLYSKSHDKVMRGMRDGNPPAMMQQDGNNTDENSADGETPPDLPSGENGNSQGGPQGKGGPQGGPGQKSNDNSNKDSNNRQNENNNASSNNQSNSNNI